MTAIRAIELFGCAGGMAEGFRRAGIEFTAAFDWDGDACASYEANLGQRPIRMDVRDLLRLLDLGWSAPPLDLVVADPPCTPWSVAGRRQGLDDERDMLRATVGVILAARPTAYLIGNVPGLDHKPNLPALREVLAPLRRVGYCVGDYARLNAADYGVPQRRSRPCWFGHRVGGCLSWPTPTHGDPEKLDVGLRPWRTIRDALGHLSPDELGRMVRVLRGHDKSADLSTDLPVLRLQSDHRLNHPDEPAHTITTRNHGARDPMVIWPWPEIGEPRSDWVSGGRAIQFGERARALLQGFPDGWEFAGRTKTSRRAQIGMAMPPPLACAVATSIRAWFEEAP